MNLQIPNLDTVFLGERTERKPSRKPLFVLMLYNAHIFPLVLFTLKINNAISILIS